MAQGLTERSEDMMATDRQAEIAASVAALQDLGPGYDQALAEGLVERIGAEVDKRIAAEIDDRVTAGVGETPGRERGVAAFRLAAWVPTVGAGADGTFGGHDGHRSPG